MNNKKGKGVRVILFGLICSTVFSYGCSLNVGVPQWSGSGFIRKEFLEYKKVAILLFENDPTGEVSDNFALTFHEKFTQIELIRRKELFNVLREQDLYPGQLDEGTRIKIGKIFSAQALIMGNVYYPSILRWLMQIEIVDIETNTIMGRSLVEINYMGAEGVKEACKLAVQQLNVK